MSDRDARVENELTRVLASEALRSSPTLSAFLRFVVEETLAGREDRLKAYTIAVGALDRSDDFDPNDNPLVRVQARRLRQALDRYYETEGRAADLVIELPLGTYVPVFREREPAGSAPPATGAATIAPPPTSPPARRVAPSPASDPTARHRVTRRVAVAGLLVGLLATAVAAGGIRLGRGRDAQPPRRPVEISTSAESVDRADVGLDASRVLPLLGVEVETRDPTPTDFHAEIFRRRVESFAQRFDDTIVVTRRALDHPPPGGQPFYGLRFLVVQEGGASNAYYQLVHVGDQRIVASGAVALAPPRVPPPRPQEAVETPAERAVVREIVQLHGTISQDLRNLADLGPELTCLTRAWSYYLESHAETHRAARACLEAVVADNPRLAPALQLLGAMYLSEYRQNFERSGGDPLIRAEEMIRRATQVAPSSSAPFQTLQSLLLLKGDIDAAVLAGTRAEQANPGDMIALASHGAVLARIGRYREAAERLVRAEAEIATPPTWLPFYAFLALNNLGRTREADDQAAFFEGTKSTLYLTAVAIRAHRRGDDPAAFAAFSAILAAEPTFRADPKQFLRRRGLAEPVIDRLMVDLVAAGLHASRT